MNYSFPCTQCGICCKNISHIRALKELDLGNGICKYLDLDSNMCKIYENRPEICNIGTMYKQYFYKTYTYSEFVRLNIKACNDMQEVFKVDKKFRIKE